MDLNLFSIIDSGLGVYDINSFEWSVNMTDAITTGLMEECNEHQSYCSLSVE